MIKPLLPALAAAAFLSLAACHQSDKPQEIDTRAPDPMASQLANAAPIELPPSISASVTFRCQPGNTLIDVNFFQGDKLVTVKNGADATPVPLNAPKAGDPYASADGKYTLTGTPKEATIVTPDGSKSCKA